MRYSIELRTLAIGALIGGALIGCSQTPYDDSGPAIDPTAPRIHITKPAFGTVAGDVESVVVEGTATDDVLVTSVEVNGVTATVSATGQFTAKVPVVPGTNLLHAVAKDAQGNLGKETRAVVAGPQMPLDRVLERSLTAAVSAQAFAALGNGASNFFRDGDLTALVTPMNPLVDAGTVNGQPDCLYGQAFITLADIGDADVHLIPQTGGLVLDATFDAVRVDSHLQWAVACLDGSRDVSLTASRIHLRGTIGAGLDFFGNIKFELTNPVVDITGFGVDVGGIPQTIIDLLDLDTRMGPVIAWAAEKFVAPMLDSALANLSQTKTVDVLGNQVAVTMRPTAIDIDTGGALVVLDSELRAVGDHGEFVMIENQAPRVDMTMGFQLALADDATNQLLTSLWSAGGLTASLELTKAGEYGEVGKLFDTVELAALAPPFIDASGDHVVLTVGDLTATFKNDGAVATKVAINAHVELVVTTDEATGALAIDVGQPQVFVDILDEGVEGANVLSNAQFEAITSFALTRVVAVGSGALRAIPLPAIGGVGMKDLQIGPQGGNIVLGGAIR